MAIETEYIYRGRPLNLMEKRIIELVSQNGLRNKEVAYQLGISEQTVKTYLSNVYLKLGITSGDREMIAKFHKGELTDVLNDVDARIAAKQAAKATPK